MSKTVLASTAAATVAHLAPLANLSSILIREGGLKTKSVLDQAIGAIGVYQFMQLKAGSGHVTEVQQRAVAFVDDLKKSPAHDQVLVTQLAGYITTSVDRLAEINKIGKNGGADHTTTGQVIAGQGADTAQPGATAS